jgi:hypothetical protein
LTIYLNDGDMINSGNLMFIKYYIKYWKHFAFKKHYLTLELNIVKLVHQANKIKVVMMFINLSYKKKIEKKDSISNF